MVDTLQLLDQEQGAEQAQVMEMIQPPMLEADKSLVGIWPIQALVLLPQSFRQVPQIYGRMRPENIIIKPQGKPS